MSQTTTECVAASPLERRDGETVLWRDIPLLRRDAFTIAQGINRSWSALREIIFLQPVDERPMGYDEAWNCINAQEMARQFMNYQPDPGRDF
jgi:hypothetical protein